MIELTVDEAKAILAAPWHLGKMTPEAGNALHALGRKLSVAEEENREALAKSVAERFSDGWARGIARARTATSPGPRWDYLARAVTVIARHVDENPAAIAKTDRLAAYMRDTLDSLGLSITDEETLYVVLATSGLLVELAANGQRSGQTDRATVLAIAAIAQTMTAALLPYLPPEAKT